ncbi:MAG: acyloxyacyl hydrolase [Nitrospirota bacterium]|jgi:lipid A 3-O-deacylase
MRLKAPLFLAVLAMVLLGAAPPGRAREDWRVSLSAWGGLPANITDNASHFSQYELFGAVRLPWSFDLPWRMRLDPALTLDVAALTDQRKVEYLPSAGFGFFVFKEGWPLALEAGYRVAYLTDEKFEEKDFGGPVQFLGHIGFDVFLFGRAGIGYRFEHMSNASIYEINPSLNLHMVGLFVFF